MSQRIQISAYEAAALAAARRAGESRTHIWRTIHGAYSIPTTVKLGMATDRTLFVRGSDPRQWLWHDHGAYVGYGVDAPVPTPRVTMHEPAPQAHRFIADNVPSQGWMVLDREQLVEFMADGEMLDDEDLPDGFPRSATGLVYDATTGSLYFKG